MKRDRYTRYPRPILWLIPEGEVLLQGQKVAVEPFYISKVPVTNEQFEAFDPDRDRSAISPGDRDPVVNVRWEDAQAYCRWYAEVSRKPMRLPTAAEWAHACRGGCGERFFWGGDVEEADLYVWDAANSDGALHSLEDRKGNGFGLFGTLGGVWEWIAGGEEERRVLRGGSFRTPRSELSCDLQKEASARDRSDDWGFRIAKSLR